MWNIDINFARVLVCLKIIMFMLWTDYGKGNWEWIFCNNSKKQVFIFAIIIKTDKDMVKIIVFKKGHFSH